MPHFSVKSRHDMPNANALCLCQMLIAHAKRVISNAECQISWWSFHPGENMEVSHWKAANTIPLSPDGNGELKLPTTNAVLKWTQNIILLCFILQVNSNYKDFYLKYSIIQFSTEKPKY